MPALPLIYAPNPIFKMKAEPITVVDDSIRRLVDDMFATVYFEGALGLGANMVGILKRIAVVDLQEKGVKSPLTFINPVITWSSDEMQTCNERSLSFPGVFADVSRPKAIKISYLDYFGKEQELEANGFLSTVIQHEVDYLNGKVFLDYISKMKRDVLMRKMQKYLKNHTPHIHGPHCHH
jgi:peptide deformylase